jgi:hypothetical protein
VKAGFPVSLIQLVPGAPPLINGVGDYGLTVARSLRETFQLNSTFVVCNPHWNGPERVDSFPAIALRSRRADHLVRLLSGLQRQTNELTVVLLQLSPYGYDANACPFWLAQGLRAWKSSHRGGCLVTYFHELYATSMPWRRAFWFSPWQRRCTRAICHLSDFSITSLQHFASILARWTPHRKGRLDTLPVVSNVGEPTQLKPHASRPRQMVVWGSSQAKQEIYRRSRRALERIVAAVQPEKIVEFGPPAPLAVAALAGIAVERLGVSPAEEISAVLADSIAGVFAYNPNCLAKSGLFAALSAHGVPAIVLPTDPHAFPEQDGIEAGKHYLRAEDMGANRWEAAALRQVGAAALEWYRPHRIASHAAAYMNALHFCRGLGMT